MALLLFLVRHSTQVIGACINSAAAGWVRIDTLNGGGGGGGGATNLGDLLDVAIASASTGALLQLQSDNQWKDVYAIDAGEY